MLRPLLLTLIATCLGEISSAQRWITTTGSMPLDSTATRLLVYPPGRCPDLLLQPVLRAAEAHGYSVHLDGQRTRRLPGTVMAVTVSDTTFSRPSEHLQIWRAHGTQPVDYVVTIRGAARNNGVDDFSLRIIDAETGQLYVQLLGPVSGLTDYEDIHRKLVEALRPPKANTTLE